MIDLENISNEEIIKSQVFITKDIMDILQDELENIMGYDPFYYEKYNIILKNEQMYVKSSDRKEFESKDNILLIVKFLPAKIDLDQSIIPLTITAISEHNNIEVCQKLLMEFTQAFTLREGTYLNSKTRKKTFFNQRYQSPSVISNFQTIFSGYRSVLTVSGEFLISANINASYLYYYPNYNEETGEPGKPEIIKALNNSSSYNATLDSQPFTNNKNFIKSIVKFSINMFTISSYRLDCDLHNKALKVKYKVLPIDTNFYFGIKFDNQEKLNGTGEPFITSYKLQDASSTTNAGELAIITLVFTE